jgi:hypothetical protein
VELNFHAPLSVHGVYSDSFTLDPNIRHRIFSLSHRLFWIDTSTHSRIKPVSKMMFVCILNFSFGVAEQSDS